ncbi:hypothetical protein D3C72_1826010 [compost metagenome]
MILLICKIEIIFIGLTISDIFWIFHKYTLIRISQSGRRTYCIFITSSSKLTTNQVRLIELFLFPIVIHTKDIVLVNDDNVCVVSCRMDQNLIFPLRIVNDKQLFKILNTKPLIKIFIEIKAKKLSLLVAIEVHFSINGMNRGSITLPIGGQHFSILPLSITR